MAKTIGMARSMWRLQKRELVPSKMIRTEFGLFMCQADFDKFRNLPQATSAIEFSPVGPPRRLHGIPVHITETCAPYWRTSAPLRRAASGYLRRHAHRRIR